jgi:uncharacterized membrane protein
MRVISNKLANNDVIMFDAKPMPLTAGKYGGGGSPVSGGWYGGNPDDIQPIMYYLKDRASADVKIDIYDAAGQLVQTLPGTRRKGINKVYWNLRCKPPKTATGGAKMDNGGFMAPMVLPGTYTAKLKLGEKEFATPLIMVHDTSNKLFSLADRNVQHKAAMDLYHLHEELRTLVDKVNAEQKMLKDNVDSIANPKAKKMLTEYHTKLEELRATLLGTKSTSIFADEKKLREEITELYATMCYIESRPANMQLARVTSLTEEEKKAEESFGKLVATYHAKAEKAIADNNLKGTGKVSKPSK